MSRDIDAVQNSLFQPRCIAGAFAELPKRWIFTMQVWINLDYVRSPLLEGGVPGSIDELEAALAAFHYAGPSTFTPQELVRYAEEMRAEVVAAHDTILPMNPPVRAEDHGDGFGHWVKLLSALIVQGRISLREALQMPVGQAYALLAAMRCNQGWTEAGTPYALRDLDARGEEAANG